jgi:hypothetical protein
MKPKRRGHGGGYPILGITPANRGLWKMFTTVWGWYGFKPEETKYPVAMKTFSSY